MRNPVLDMRDDELTPQEKQFEKALRPKGLAEFSGQSEIVENLYVFIEAAKQRKEALDHVLLPWPSRFGKNHPFPHYCD
jgi:Holliday junction DNA helicase RuvB